MPIDVFRSDINQLKKRHCDRTSCVSGKIEEFQVANGIHAILKLTKTNVSHFSKFCNSKMVYFE